MEDSTEEAKDEEVIAYSEKYYDDTYEYRHVILPPKIAVEHPMVKLLEEDEWRAIGVCQSLGWVNYAIHRPEPHIMLFRRPRKNMNSGDPLDNQQQQQPQGLHDGQEKKPNPQG